MDRSRRVSLRSAATACLLVATGSFAPAAGQSESPGLPFQLLDLTDLRASVSAEPNWRTVGDLSVDRRRRHHLTTSPGTGVLVNLPGRDGGSNLFTRMEHGDIELELEVLLPRGTDSGIYLQGRYELQLRDSWGVRNPTFADAGGIYERGDAARPDAEPGYGGQAPRVNASRAPGLWQKLEILFRAPRFDAQGNKIANARFVRVVHNGIPIHENVEVPGPTRAAAFQDERPVGPLVLQGDHGPVAFRNIRYKRYSGEALRLRSVRYQVYEGEFGDLAEAVGGTPVREGAADGISTAVAGVQDQFALRFDGIVSIPTSGRYRFELRFDWIDGDPHFAGRVLGGGRLTIAGRDALVHEGRVMSTAGDLELPAGDHPFSLTLYKNRPWTEKTGMALHAEGPEIARHPLHDVTASPSPLPNPILVQPGGEVAVLRGFVQHAERKWTHAVSVGDPSGLNYAYDLGGGALLYAWRGPFLETTDMWHARGEHQLARPRGSVLPISAGPQLAFLGDASFAWPDSMPPEAGYRFGGYTVDAAGRPTFLYGLGDLEVKDRLVPADAGTSLRRELDLRAPEGARELYVRVAEGDRIRRLRDGSYLVGDRDYYVSVERGGPRPVLRSSGGRQELLVPVRFRRGAGRVAYTIIW